jgi:hypothetical protein
MKPSIRLSITLTPLIPLSLAGRGGKRKKRGLCPLLNTPESRSLRAKPLRVGRKRRVKNREGLGSKTCPQV